MVVIHDAIATDDLYALYHKKNSGSLSHVHYCKSQVVNVFVSINSQRPNDHHSSNIESLHSNRRAPSSFQINRNGVVPTPLLGSERTSAHIELLDRSFGSDIKVKDINGKTQSSTSIGDL